MSEQKMPEGMAEMIDQANFVEGTVAAQSAQIQAGQKEEWARDLLRHAELHVAKVEVENHKLKRELSEARAELETVKRERDLLAEDKVSDQASYIHLRDQRDRAEAALEGANERISVLSEQLDKANDDISSLVNQHDRP